MSFTKKVLIISYVRGDTRRYRVLHTLEQLALLVIDGRYIHLSDLIICKELSERRDFVLLHRVPFDQCVQKLIHKQFLNNLIVFSDFDDLIFDLGAFRFINSPDFSDAFRVNLYLQEMQRIYATLQRSEGSLASTNYLAARIRQEGKPAWVHRNAFSLEMLKQSEKARLEKKKRDALVIGYASGTPTHNRDFEMIKPALIEVMRKYRHVELHIIGPLDIGEGWGVLSERIRHFPLVPWRELPFVLAGFDINLAPLVMDNPFAQSKSEIKWMEAAMVETPTIASPTEAFRYAVHHHENGWLAETSEDWVTGLETLVEDSMLRERLARQAYFDVQQRYHPAQRAVELASTLDDIFNNLRGEPFFTNGVPTREEVMSRAEGRDQAQVWIPVIYERDPSYLKLGIYALRTRGIKNLLMSVWVFFRRMIAPIFPFRKL